MLKQKYKKNRLSLKFLTGAISIGALLIISTFLSTFARADQFDAQIKLLQRQNASNQARSNNLAEQADSYQGAVDRLEQRINALQQAIVANQHDSEILKKKIKLAQAELEHQKDVLGKNIKTMYLEGQISTLEILAASRDLSDFVNKEEYRTVVQNQVKATVDKINELKVQLEKKNRELESRIKDQQSQQADLNEAQNQQAQLLAYTEGQKAAYDHQIRSNNSRISSLRAQQAAQNAALGGRVVAGDPGHGGYPAYLDYARQDSLIDPWGMYNRECVSYTAWKVQQATGHMPYWGGHGNANQWPASAQAGGIATGYTPRVHSVAISMSGYYGHAMWVEAVSGSTIYVSQYNFDLAGHYSEMSVNGSGFIYIYF